MFENHFSQVRNYVFYRSGNAEIATDIAQEAFLKIWEKQHNIQHKKVKGLLYKIAGDLYVSHYRRERRTFQFFNNYLFNDEFQSPEEQMAFEQLKEAYMVALKKMKENQRTVFLMSRAENMKYSEIAVRLGISVKAVEKRMKHALEHLRNFLQK